MCACRSPVAVGFVLVMVGLGWPSPSDAKASRIFADNEANFTTLSSFVNLGGSSFTRTSNIKIKSRSKNVILRALFISAAIAIAAIGAAPAATAAPPSKTAPPYKNCTAARADGRHDVPIGDPGYGDWLDRDHDGIACES
jgi:hypothetical protein